MPTPEMSLLPQAQHAEVAVLGAMLLDNRSIDRVAHVLKEQHFYSPANQKIYAAILKLHNAQKKVDVVTVCGKLASLGQIKKAPHSYVCNLVDGVVSTEGIRDHADLIIQKAHLRELIVAAQHIQSKASNEPEDVTALLDEAEQLIFAIRQKGTEGHYTGIDTALHETFTYFEEIQSGDGHLVGVPTGFKKLDDLTTGFSPGEFVILAGRPSLGKSAVAFNWSRNMAVDYNKVVGIFSLEMSRKQVSQRLLASEAEVNLLSLRTGRASQEDHNRISAVVSRLANAKIWIDDTAALTVADLRSRARRMKAEKDVDILFVDYLQLVRAGTRAMGKYEEVSYVSKMLKALAKEVDVPLVALSQLSRGVTERADHRPQLSDLRDSGALEEDADVVIFVHRPEYYFPEKEEFMGTGELLLRKQRNGPTGKVELRFYKEFAKFVETEVW